MLEFLIDRNKFESAASFVHLRGLKVGQLKCTHAKTVNSYVVLSSAGWCKARSELGRNRKKLTGVGVGWVLMNTLYFRLILRIIDFGYCYCVLNIVPSKWS